MGYPMTNMEGREYVIEARGLRGFEGFEGLIRLFAYTFG